MEPESLPSPDPLATELGKFVRNGLGRDLPGAQNEETVQALSDLSRELADDPSEEWTIRIARVVIEEVKRISPAVPGQLVLADLLALGDLGRSVEEIIEAIENGAPVASLQERYAQAATWYSPKATVRTVEEKYRPELLNRLAKRLLERLHEKRSKPDGSDKPSPSEDGPPVLLVGTVGAILVVVGVAWLIAVATGVFS